VHDIVKRSRFLFFLVLRHTIKHLVRVSLLCLALRAQLDLQATKDDIFTADAYLEEQ